MQVVEKGGAWNQSTAAIEDKFAVMKVEANVSRLEVKGDYLTAHGPRNGGVLVVRVNTGPCRETSY
jgi:hypothetical protein